MTGWGGGRVLCVLARVRVPMSVLSCPAWHALITCFPWSLQKNELLLPVRVSLSIKGQCELSGPLRFIFKVCDTGFKELLAFAQGTLCLIAGLFFWYLTTRTFACLELGSCHV